MKLAATSLLLVIVLTGCGEKPKPKATTKNYHALASTDLRGWDTYNALVLVATKNVMGIDTVAQLIKDYDKLVDGGAIYEMDAQLPTISGMSEETRHSVAIDRAFFVTQGKKYGVFPSTIATVLMDFYTLGGSNRDYPEPNGNE